jgi:CHAT domain-containing protein
MGRTGRAKEVLERALSIRQTVGFRDAEAESEYELGLTHRDLGALQPAERHLRNASDLLDEIRGRVAGEHSRLMYVAARRRYYAAYIDVLMALHDANPSRGYAIRAFEVAERDRARVLVDALRESRADIRRDADPVLLERARDVRRELDFWSMQLARLTDRKSPPAAVERTRDRVNALLLELREAEARIRAASPRYAELTNVPALTLPQIQQQIGDRDTLLLRFFLGERRSYLWLVAPDDFSVTVLPPRSAIADLAARLSQAIQSRTSAGEGLPSGGDAQALSRMLLDRVAGRLGTKQLLIVCDGELQQVPFAALPEPRRDSPLLVRHEIVMLPSASALAALRQQVAARPPADKAVVIVADPVYEAEDPRLSAAVGAAGSRRVRSDEVSRFGRLPFSKGEGEAILGRVPAAQRSSAFGFEASRDNVLNGLLRGYRIVHIAAHAVVDEARPELSGVVLSQYRRDGTVQDGRLRLHDIANLDLQASLVVIGACESTTGLDVPGEGLMGLARGFLGAGAGTVIGSLFPIEEDQALEFMKIFYGELLGPRRLSPAAALRAAQLQMLERPRFRHPFFWSAFVVIGDPR